MVVVKIDSCPYCNKKLKKIPSRKSKCEYCQKFIYVRTRPSDRKIVLVSEEELKIIESEWNKHYEEKNKSWFEKHGKNSQENYEIKKKSKRYSLEKFKEAGLKYVKCVAKSDDRVCKECNKLADKEFEIDMLLRTDKNRLPLHEGCRCSYKISFKGLEETKSSEVFGYVDEQEVIEENNYDENIEKNNFINQSDLSDLKNKVKLLKKELNELIMSEIFAYGFKGTLSKSADLISGYKIINIIELSKKIDYQLKSLGISESQLNKKSSNFAFIKFFSSYNNYDVFKNISKDLSNLRSKINDKHAFVYMLADIKSYLKKVKKIEEELEKL